MIYFGDIALGNDHLTGPTQDSWKFKKTTPKHAVTRGKPVPQNVGEELDVRNLAFFYDENFCDPEVVYARLLAAYKSRSPAALFIDAQPFTGTQYVVDALDAKVIAKTKAGRITRIEVKITLEEEPRLGASFGLIGAVLGVASAIVGRATSNPNVRR